MRIVINELKKLFSMKSILIFILITVVYNLYIMPWEGMIANVSILNKIYVNMIEKYGERMDIKEYKDFLTLYEKNVDKADEFIKNNNEFRNLGIYNYEEYNKISRNNGEEKYDNPKLKEFYYDYLYSEDVGIFRELEEMQNIIMTYEAHMFNPYEESENDKKSVIDRDREIEKGEEIKSLLPYTVFQDYEIQFRNLAKLILISIIFIISPIYLNDKINKVNYLQYQSKHGREIFKSKVSATLIATLLITTIHLILFFTTIYFKYTYKLFLNCGISGFYNTPIKSWFDLTFGQYILITCILVYVLSIIIGLASMYISSKVDNYISLIGIQVPMLFVVSRVFMKFIINNATCMYIPIRGFYRFLRVPKYFLPVVYTILIIIVSFILYKRYKNEKSASIN